jgi:hypothetical protein
MAVTTAYEIEIHYITGGVSTTLDFTNRCQGFKITQKADVGTFGSGNCQITLRNDDGALTPGAGGTYTDLDWFNTALWIHADVTGDETSATFLFEGIVTDIEFFDDGTNSTVRITANDAFSIGGRTPIDADLSIPGATTIFTSARTAIEALYNGYTSGGTEYIPKSIFPDLGNSNGAEINMFTASSVASWTPQILDDLTNQTPADIINNSVMPSGPCAAWPTLMSMQGGSGGSVEYQAYIVEKDLTKDTGTGSQDLRTFPFAENPGTGELPFRNLVRSFNVEALTNSAQLVRSTAGATVQTSQDSPSVAKYGARNRAYITTNQNDSDTTDAAYRWSHRFSQSRFTPLRLEITDRMAESLADADDDLWEDLIDVRTGLWSIATVEYTPAGAATSTTDVCVIVGRSFNGTPSQVTLTLDLVPAQDYQSFVLDSDTLGVLDTNRLG